MRGRRKRLIQVSYVILAVLFGVGLVGFGVGTGGSGGGLFDAIGGGGGSADSAFDDEVSNARTATKQSPKSAKAWLDLARAEFTLSQSPAGIDPEAGAYTDKGETAANEGVAAWERYAKLVNGEPNAGIAQYAADTYAQLGDAEGAQEAQQIVVDGNPKAANAWAFLSLFAYANGDNELGGEAQTKAISLTPRDQRNTAKDDLEDKEKAGKKYAREVAKAKEEAEKAKSQGGGDAGQGFGPLPGQGGIPGQSGGGLTPGQ
ncbi:MAG: hypothetical protein WDZ37_03780 [Solirubrobacterales bacterium]